MKMKKCPKYQFSRENKENFINTSKKQIFDQNNFVDEELQK